MFAQLARDLSSIRGRLLRPAHFLSTSAPAAAASREDIVHELTRVENAGPNEPRRRFAQNDIDRIGEIMARHGVVLLPDVMPVAWVDQCRSDVTRTFEECLDRIHLQTGEPLQMGMQHGYREIVHRAPGRYDVLYRVNGSEELRRFEQLWHEPMRALLGDRYHCLFNGLLMTEQGAGEHGWHVDGEHLFQECDVKRYGEVSPANLQNNGIMPAHCINLFAPLCDITSTNGQTEFAMGSHHKTHRATDDIVWQDSGHVAFAEDCPIAQLESRVGDILIFDYRLLHRALPHTDPRAGRRPVMYFTYARSWFQDALNFPERSLFASGTPAAKAIDSESPSSVEGTQAGTGDDLGSLVRPLFDAFAVHHPHRHFCDGAAGSQVPRSVVSAMARYMAETNANLGGEYITSQKTLTGLHRARQTMASLFNCGSEEVIFGHNMTSLTWRFAPILAQHWRDMDSGTNGSSSGAGKATGNIVLSQLDHDGNVAAWLRLADECGYEVRWLPVDPESVTLESDRLGDLVDSDTRLVALGAASNFCGTINPVSHMARVCRQKSPSCLVYVDAVHYAPHNAIDVRGDWADVDVVVCSPYKFFGPHCGLAYMKREWNDKLTVASQFKCRPTPDTVPTLDSYEISRWELGTTNYEAVQGAKACVEYIAGLPALVERRTQGSVTSAPVPEFFSSDDDSNDAAADKEVSRRLRSALIGGFDEIQRQERSLARRFLEGVAELPGVGVLGHSSVDNVTQRTSTFAVQKAGVSAADLTLFLNQRSIHCTYGNHYALGVSRRLGVEEEGGVLRISFMHYNTAADVDAALRALAEA